VKQVRRILVGVGDLNAKTQPAVRKAAVLAEAFGAELALFHAMSVPVAEFEHTAAAVNALPEVAHNYAREHALNMWFVLATESAEATADAIDRIETRTGLPVLTFPKEREFFVGLDLKSFAPADGEMRPAEAAPVAG